MWKLCLWADRARACLKPPNHGRAIWQTLLRDFRRREASTDMQRTPAPDAPIPTHTVGTGRATTLGAGGVR